jgi:hypothetical protein
MDGPGRHITSIVQRSNSNQFVSKLRLDLKRNGQNGILERANAVGFPAQGAALALEVPDLIAFSAAKRPRACRGGSLPGMLRPCGTAAMTKEEERELRATLMRLQQEHRDLDAAIGALQNTIGSDSLQVQRLKKRKLFLRDRITFIEDQLTPDIIA